MPMTEDRAIKHIKDENLPFSVFDMASSNKAVGMSDSLDTLSTDKNWNIVLTKLNFLAKSFKYFSVKESIFDT